MMLICWSDCSKVSCFLNLSDFVEGFLGFGLPGGLWWEGGHGGIGGNSCRLYRREHFGDSFCNLIAVFLCKWQQSQTGVCSSSVTGKVPYTCSS